jgi:hypothetical protein
MPIFCNSIKQVLAAFAFKSGHIFGPACNDSGGPGAAGKLWEAIDELPQHLKTFRVFRDYCE